MVNQDVFINIIALIIKLLLLWGTIKLFIFLIKLPFRIIKNSSHSTSSTKNSKSQKSLDNKDKEITSKGKSELNSWEDVNRAYKNKEPIVFKNPVSKSWYTKVNEYEDNIRFPVFKIDSTNLFSSNLKNMDIDKIGVYVAKPTENGQILGAYVIHNKDSLGTNKKLIYDEIITRNDDLRRLVYIPGYDKVKFVSKYIGDYSYPVYERTHLIAFRHSLQEGECENLLITGTAKLNQGRNYKTSIIPTDFDKQQIHEYLIKTFRNNNYKIKFYNKYFNQISISLDDTERFYDFLLNTQFHYEKGRRIPDLLKYSVECKYLKEDSLIPHHVIVRISNLTRHQPLAYFKINNY